METVGQRVRKEREARKVSRPELAKAAGIGVSTLSDLELDRSQSTTKLHRIADYLGVRPEWLETGKGAKAAESNNVHPTGREPAMDPAQVISRLQDDIDALRYALSGLVATMTVYRPVEAAAAAQAIRHQDMPAKFRTQGFAYDIAATLELAAKPETSAPAGSRARANRRSSRPK